ncbi:MAG: HD-GYP domain-containing protein [Gemmatimonadetes bacterium]|nr:HD-GYP domain-containing protein [Gemmatimonadota bacterium]
MFSTIDAKSPWTAGHSERVTHLAIAIGRQLQLDSTQLDRLYRGGMVHDIGKLAVPTAILDKRGRLTAVERRIVERHPGAGFDLLAPLVEFADVLPIVRSHHERPDGRGYPDRLAGDEIPWLARVLAVADVYDALTSDRPYRAGMDRDMARGLMIAGSGSWLDADVLEAFLALDLRADLLAMSLASGHSMRSARPEAADRMAGHAPAA